MRRALRVHPAAEAELLDAAIFLNEQTPGAGDNFVVALGIAMRKARRAPRIGQLVTAKRTKAEIRRVRVRRKPGRFAVGARRGVHGALSSMTRPMVHDECIRVGALPGVRRYQ